MAKEYLLPSESATSNAEWTTEDNDNEITPVASSSTGRDLIELVIFILLIMFIQRGLIQNFRIEGPSMRPNLEPYQYIFANKIVYFHYDSNAPRRLIPGNGDLPVRLVYPFRTPERGDIVVLEAPRTGDEAQLDYIKRVIGLPGETIQIKNGKVFINGQELYEPYLDQTTDCGVRTEINNGLCDPYVVPQGTVVVLGDNRAVSQDSRRWNAEPGLPFDRVIGQAWLSYWPREDWGFIPDPKYIFGPVPDATEVGPTDVAP